MFLRLEADLQGTGLLGAPLQAQFDEQRGFITEYRFGRPSRGGLLGQDISECCIWFEFDKFTDLSP
jgi:hypothetical protein